MSQDPSSERLSRISTLWSLIEKAHGEAPNERISAQNRLMQRYCGAAYRYLLGAVRDEEAALELFQEFALRFVRGDFRRADPGKGRFRDYLRRVLINLVNDLKAAGRDRPRPLCDDLVGTEPDAADASNDPFVRSWKEELIDRTWDALKQVNDAYHAVLLCHVENQDLPSAEIAERLSRELNRTFTPGSVRVTLHRARERFGDLLLDEVTHSLDHPTDDDLEAELRDLGLMSWCRAAFEARRGRT